MGAKPTRFLNVFTLVAFLGVEPAWAIRTFAITALTYETTWNSERTWDVPQGDTLSTVAIYRYDGLGRRIEKAVNGVITRYVYDNEGKKFPVIFCVSWSVRRW